MGACVFFFLSLVCIRFGALLTTAHQSCCSSAKLSTVNISALLGLSVKFEFLTV